MPPRPPRRAPLPSPRCVAAREALDAARRTRRVADEADRTAASAAENAARELAWQEALLERARDEAATAREEARQRAAELTAFDESRTGEGASDRGQVARSRRWRRAWPRCAASGMPPPKSPLRRAPHVTAPWRIAVVPRSAWGWPRRASRSSMARRSRSAAAMRTSSPSASAWPLSWPRRVAVQQGESEAFEASVASARAERNDLLAGGSGRQRAPASACAWPRAAAARARWPRWRRGCRSMLLVRACSWSWPRSATMASGRCWPRAGRPCRPSGPAATSCRSCSRPRSTLRSRPGGTSPPPVPSPPSRHSRAASPPSAGASTTSAPATPSRCRSWPRSRSAWSRWRRSARTSRRPSARRAR